MVCSELKAIVAGETRDMQWYKNPLAQDDITSRGMGQQGEDVILTAAARNLFGQLKIECKNTEKLNVPGVFFEHREKYPKSVPVLVHKRNRSDALVTMELTQFLRLLRFRVRKRMRRLHRQSA